MHGVLLLTLCQQHRAPAFHELEIRPAACVLDCIATDPPTASLNTQPQRVCNAQSCSQHSTCFLGACLCDPGFTGHRCTQRLADMKAANPWYTADCPNLQAVDTLDENVSFASLRGKRDCCVKESCGALAHLPSSVQRRFARIRANNMGTGLGGCAYLCYAQAMTGTTIIPWSLWTAAQQAEGRLWKSVHPSADSAGDRFEDHWAGFRNFACLPTSLGSVVEFGAGPWTQTRGLLHKRPDVLVERFTIFEPGAPFYMKSVPSCSYRDGTRLKRLHANGSHVFPLHIVSLPGEAGLPAGQRYDTVISINVIEHVRSAVDYLHSLHAALKPGGLLIFHDRYYTSPPEGDLVLGRNPFHPVRVTRMVFDHFLSQFDVIFNNCHGEENIPGWRKRNALERGYYVIARKKTPIIRRRVISPDQVGPTR